MPPIIATKLLHQALAGNPDLNHLIHSQKGLYQPGGFSQVPLAPYPSQPVAGTSRCAQVTVEIDILLDTDIHIAE